MSTDPTITPVITPGPAIETKPQVIATPQNMPTAPVAPVLESVKSEKKTNNTILVLLGVLVVILLAANLIYLVTNNNKVSTTPTPTPTVTTTASVSPSVTATNTVTATATVTPTTSVTVTPFVVAGRLEVSAPVANATIPSDVGTIVLRGKMKGFYEGTMAYRFENANGEVLYSGSVTAAGDNYEAFSNFAETVNLPSFPVAKRTATATLYFLELSMKDGTEKKLVAIPLKMN